MEDARIHTSADTRSKEGTGCTGLDNPDEPLRCVFSSVTTIKVGTGTTVKKQKSKLLWYVKQQDPDAFGIRKINPNFVPIGEEKIIDQEELLTNYTPEVEIHNTQVEPAMCQLRKTVAKGDKYRAQGKTHSAEMEYERALEVDVTNVRATFGLGLVYLERGDRKNSRMVFEQLVALEAAFDIKHKHLFNDFGMALRKNELYDEAVKYYTRAAELTAEDEHLYYNLSRVFYEMDDWENCFEFTARALKLNPHFEHGIEMCRLMVGLAKTPSLCAKYGRSEVPVSVADGAGMFLTEENTEMIDFGSVSFVDGSLEKIEGGLVTGRLEATVFGSMVSVCALRMNKTMVKAGMAVYGRKKWDALINGVCFGPNPKKVIADIRHTIGHDIGIEYRGSGVSMQTLGFGFEVFHNGEFCEIDTVSAEISSLQPGVLMRQYKPGEMLGVFWGIRTGFMSFRWDDVESPQQEDIALVYMDIAPGLARKRTFDIVIDVTFDGRKGKRTPAQPAGSVEDRKNVLHVKK